MILITRMLMYIVLPPIISGGDTLYMGEFLDVVFLLFSFSFMLRYLLPKRATL